jgi:CheY-like chemotaxis protein
VRVHLLGKAVLQTNIVGSVEVGKLLFFSFISQLMTEPTPSKRASASLYEQGSIVSQDGNSNPTLSLHLRGLEISPRVESALKKIRSDTDQPASEALPQPPVEQQPNPQPIQPTATVLSTHSITHSSIISSAANMSTLSAPTNASSPPSEPQTVVAPRDVLLVEDVRVSQRIARVALARARFRVDVAENGEEAVDKFQKGKFDVILMDIQLPKMNGIEATIKIREIEKKESRSPVIIFGLTGSLSESDLAAYRAAGMQGCIGKGSVLESAVPEALDEYEKKPNEFVILRLTSNFASPAVVSRQISNTPAAHAPAVSSLNTSARASMPSTRAIGSSRSLHIGHAGGASASTAPTSSLAGPSSHASSHSVSHQPAQSVSSTATPIATDQQDAEPNRS